MKKRNNYKNGFTLLEIALYLSILSMLVFGIGSYVNLVSFTSVKNQTVTEVEGQALHIIETFRNAVRGAASVSAPSIGGSGDHLSLTPESFSLEDGKLMIDRGYGDVPLNNDRVIVSDLEFRNLSRSGTPGVIQISFTLSYSSGSENQIYNYSQNYVTAARLY